MDFSEALVKLKQGVPIRRKGWEVKDVYLKLSKVTIAHIDLCCASNNLKTGWIPLFQDLKADDWEVFESLFTNQGFSTALKALLDGKTISRFCWNTGNRMPSIKMVTEPETKEPQPYICENGIPSYVWIPSESELLAEDWVIFD